MLTDEIGYIRLDQFNNLSPGDVAEAVEELLSQGMKGLIFDLRNNAGGPLDAAVGVADQLVSDGVLVYYEDSEGNRQEYKSSDGGQALAIPLVILVNGNTASASEIVVGAVKDTKTGLVVGENTFGKGVVQNVFVLSDGSGLVLTTGRYLTPEGHEITQDGITPDVVSDLDPERLRREYPEIDEFLDAMDELNKRFVELRKQMFDYLQKHDFQREKAVEVLEKWIKTGSMPDPSEFAQKMS